MLKFCRMYRKQRPNSRAMDEEDVMSQLLKTSSPTDRATSDLIPTMDYLERYLPDIAAFTTTNSHIRSALKAFSPTKFSKMAKEDDFFDDWCRNLAETNDSSPEPVSSPECPAPPRRLKRVAKRQSRRRKLMDASPTNFTPPTHLENSPFQSAPKRSCDSPISSRSKIAKRLPLSPEPDTSTPASPLAPNTPLSPITRLPLSPDSPQQTPDAESENHLLPTVPGKVVDVNNISTETMADLLTGRLHTEAHVTIVDCRYPYEFDGGHINGAINLFTKDEVTKHFFPSTNETTDREHVIIFHCEFSSERGPKMYRHLRSHDRDVNAANYPRLSYPHIYLLQSGYSAFYPDHKDLCTPGGYTSMFDHAHKQDLKKFRVKSKSFPPSRPRHRDHADVRVTLKF